MICLFKTMYLKPLPTASYKIYTASFSKLWQQGHFLTNCCTATEPASHHLRSQARHTFQGQDNVSTHKALASIPQQKKKRAKQTHTRFKQPSFKKYRYTVKCYAVMKKWVYFYANMGQIWDKIQAKQSDSKTESSSGSLYRLIPVCTSVH